MITSPTIEELEKEIDFTYYELEEMRDKMSYKTFKAFESSMLDYIQELTDKISKLKNLSA